VAVLIDNLSVSKFRAKKFIQLIGQPLIIVTLIID